MSFRKYERTSKKVSKKFDVPRRNASKSRQRYLPHATCHMVQQQLLNTTNCMDQFKFWLKPCNNIQKYEEEKYLSNDKKLELVSSFSNQENLDTVTYHSDDKDFKESPVENEQITAR